MSWTVAWVVVGLAALVLEVAALLNPAKGDTLSEHAWKWLEGKPLRHFLLGSFLLWLMAHWFTGGKFG